MNWNQRNLKRALTFLTLSASILFLPNLAKAQTPSQLASAMTGQTITVHCIAMRGMYGYTEQGSSAFLPDEWLSPQTCEGLRGLDDHKLFNYADEANALATILHESMHIRLNSSNEAKVECTAMENLWNWLTPYGFTKAQNTKLYQAAWNIHYGLPQQYIGTCNEHKKDKPRPIAKPKGKS